MSDFVPPFMLAGDDARESGNVPYYPMQGEQASATNGANATQTVAAGASADITGCAISVTESDGRPIYLVAQATGLATEAPTNASAQGQLFLYETTTGSAVPLATDVEPILANSNAVQCKIFYRLGVVSALRTFKLTWTSIDCNFTVENNVTVPGWAAQLSALSF